MSQALEQHLGPEHQKLKFSYSASSHNSHCDLMEALECHCARADFLLKHQFLNLRTLSGSLMPIFSIFFDLSLNDSDCDFVLDYPINLQHLGNDLGGTETVISVIKSQLWKRHSVTHTLTSKPNTLLLQHFLRKTKVFFIAEITS